MMNNRLIKTLIAVGFIGAVASGCDTQNNTAESAEREYLATFTRPNDLHIIDTETNQLAKTCNVPGGPGPGTVVLAPDNTVAYILSDHFADVFGIRLADCEVVFSTKQSQANIRVKSMASIAISHDGSEIYTHQNRVRLMHDHYEVLDSQVAVFDTSAGLNVTANRSFDAPRQVTTMDTLASGSLVLGGGDIYEMDVQTGEVKLMLASRSFNDPQFAQRDVLTVWPLGRINNEFIRLYSTARYNGEPGDLDNADWLWGYESVNLTTGAAEAKEFGPLTTVLFTGARRPGHLNKVYGVLNHLTECDADTQQETRSIDLEHTYYCINFSLDGSKIYLSGALDDIVVYDADSFEKIANIPLTGDGSMANSVVFKHPALG